MRHLPNGIRGPLWCRNPQLQQRPLLPYRLHWPMDCIQQEKVSKRRRQADLSNVQKTDLWRIGCQEEVRGTYKSTRWHNAPGSWVEQRWKQYNRNGVCGWANKSLRCTTGSTSSCTNSSKLSIWSTCSCSSRSCSKCFRYCAPFFIRFSSKCSKWSQRPSTECRSFSRLYYFTNLKGNWNAKWPMSSVKWSKSRGFCCCS